jgi:hypothetical protein
MFVESGLRMLRRKCHDSRNRICVVGRYLDLEEGQFLEWCRELLDFVVVVVFRGWWGLLLLVKGVHGL